MTGSNGHSRQPAASAKQQALDAIAAERWEEARDLLLPLLESCHGDHRCEMLNDLATLHRISHDHASAIRLLAASLGECPDHAFSHASMGTVLAEAGRHVDAQAYFDRAVCLAPDNAGFQFGRAENLLSLGRYSEGWEAYEWRWKGRWRDKRIGSLIQTGSPPDLRALKGASLLLIGEVGYGDFIMFARYFPLLLERVECLHVVVPESLRGLFARSFPGCSLIVASDRFPDPDYVCSIMSLPRLFDTQQESIPVHIPYLHVDSTAVVSKQHGMKSIERNRLGIVWRGNPNRSIERYPLRARSIPLALLAPLLTAGWECHALQPELSPQEEQMLQQFPALHAYAGVLRDFEETAVLLRCMDVVVTVDTSVAHLSLALGCPTAVLLPPGADYRWQPVAGRDGSAWYPQAALYRRAASETWSAPIARLIQDLQRGILTNGQPLRPEPRIRVEYAASRQLQQIIDYEKQENQMAQKITINGKEYDFENLSETARNQIMNLRVADSRIIQLEQDLALAKTARAAYAGLLSRELPKESA